jgi:hypothetical protein
MMQHSIKPVAEKAGIKGLKGWHTLRHSYAKILRQHNGDVKVTQELLRHSSIKVTMDLYAQAVSHEKRVAHTNVVECWSGGKCRQPKAYKRPHETLVYHAFSRIRAKRLKRFGVPNH